jgi:hypothetical protein
MKLQPVPAQEVTRKHRSSHKETIERLERELRAARPKTCASCKHYVKVEKEQEIETNGRDSVLPYAIMVCGVLRALSWNDIDGEYQGDDCIVPVTPDFGCNKHEPK